MNTPVSYAIAKLLKEKGFNEPCTTIVTKENKYHLVSGTEKAFINGISFTIAKNKGLPDHICSAPTIADVVMWLYEKHGIWISVSITIQKEYYYQCIDITGKKDSTKNNYPSRICKPGNYYNSPTEAYEAAFEYALNKLI
jgi:hypothetical protein